MGVYHCMTRTVDGAFLFGDREKEIFRKMLWQVADFSGVEVLTYCVMSNHFHVLVRVDGGQRVSDGELMRRYRVLYPKPTKYQAASAKILARKLRDGGEEAEAIRAGLRARMGDVSAFMKTLKQRFTVWYNQNHDRFGTLWAERFKSVLVEGRGNPLQTVAAYIDLNPVRAGLVDDPKDYRFCGYAEAVAGSVAAGAGLSAVWWAYADGTRREGLSAGVALKEHRALIFGRHASDPGLPEISREEALRVLKQGERGLSKAAMLRCRVRYFTDGAILGSADFVSRFTQRWGRERRRKRPPKVHPLRGVEWGDLSVIQGLRKGIFG
ncbi:MAG: transposase [Opitutales bacterium]